MSRLSNFLRRYRLLIGMLVGVYACCYGGRNDANAQDPDKWPLMEVYLKGNDFMVKNAPNIKKGTDIPFMIETVNSEGDYTSLAVIAAPLYRKPVAFDCPTDQNTNLIISDQINPNVLAEVPCSPGLRLFVNKAAVVARSPLPKNFGSLDRGTILVKLPPHMKWTAHAVKAGVTIIQKADDLIAINGAGQEQVVFEGNDPSKPGTGISLPVWVLYRGSGVDVTYEVSAPKR